MLYEDFLILCQWSSWKEAAGWPWLQRVTDANLHFLDDNVSIRSILFWMGPGDDKNNIIENIYNQSFLSEVVGEAGHKSLSLLSLFLRFTYLMSHAGPYSIYARGFSWILSPTPRPPQLTQIFPSYSVMLSHASILLPMLCPLSRCFLILCLLNKLLFTVQGSAPNFIYLLSLSWPLLLW